MSSPRKSKPMVVKRGSVQVRVYRVSRKSGPQRGSEFYQVADYSSGKRLLRSFGDRERALAEADRVASLMARGEVYAANFQPKDRASYVRAIELLRPLGISLEVAVADYVDLVNLVGGQRQRLPEAVRLHLLSHPASLPDKSVAEAVAELLARKKSQGMSERYLQDLACRLGRFGTDFAMPVARITTAQVQQWMDGLKLSAQSIRNYRTVLHLFFEYCATRGYIARGANPIPETERLDIRDKEVEIFTPAEFEAILTAADDCYRPCAALQGLAGLRSNEVERLEWNDIDLERRLIVISKNVAKTASRRTIPIGDSLAGWLQAADRVGAKVWPGTHEEFYNAQNRSAKNAKIAWKHNGLRHSYASYRFALVPDAGRVAAELGHSAAILHKHYREIARAADAEKWFAVSPAILKPAASKPSGPDLKSPEVAK